MAFLTEPAERFRDSYLQALAEFEAEGRDSAESAARRFDLKEVAGHFDRFVQYLRDQADPLKVKPGWVTSSEFWLVEEEAYIGGLTLRHSLDEYLMQMGGHIGYEIRPSRRKQGYGRLILQLGLEQAKALGLQRILLTCDEHNLGSRNIIETNGGVLENIIKVQDWPGRVCRYWIAL
jgi:predicted acetyltransferase